MTKNIVVVLACFIVWSRTEDVLACNIDNNKVGTSNLRCDRCVFYVSFFFFFRYHSTHHPTIHKTVLPEGINGILLWREVGKKGMGREKEEIGIDVNMLGGTIKSDHVYTCDIKSKIQKKKTH